MGSRGVRDTAVISVAKIVVGKRHRVLEQAKVDALAESMAAIGLQHPISVCPDGDMYRLVAGSHRLQAAKKLRWVTIAAVEMTDADRELWEIDENLARAELTAEEKREHLKRRKELWEKHQAEIKEAQNSGAPCAIKRSKGRPKGFAAETAGAIGRSKSQINRMLARPKAEKPSHGKKRHRRTAAEIECEGFDGFMLRFDAFNQSKVSDPSDAALNLLNAERKADAIEIMEITVARLRKIIDRLRSHGELAARA